jgi:dephospho-CoA kinase
VKVYGLTGGIATGTSTVAQMFRELGAIVIEADQVGRELVVPGSEPLKKIAEIFGPKILAKDGTLDRKKLADIIYKDEMSRRRLNALLHPVIRRRILQEIERLRDEQPDAIVIVDVPLLLDTTGPEAYELDGVIVVSTDRATQIKRLRSRDKMSAEDAERRLGAQRAVAEKAEDADWVIDNSGSEEETRRQVDMMWEELQVR